MKFKYLYPLITFPAVIILDRILTYVVVVSGSAKISQASANGKFGAVQLPQSVQHVRHLVNCPFNYFHRYITYIFCLTNTSSRQRYSYNSVFAETLNVTYNSLFYVVLLFL